jgi:hypothetical protein
LDYPIYAVLETGRLEFDVAKASVFSFLGGSGWAALAWRASTWIRNSIRSPHYCGERRPANAAHYGNPEKGRPA